MRSIYGYLLAAGAVLIIGAAGVAQDAPASLEKNSDTGRIEGNVLEILDVSGYTYVQVDAGGDKVWAAAPSVAVQVGDTVSFSTNMPMRDFYSKSLEREFEILYFVDRFMSDAGVSSIDSDAAAAHGQMSAQQAVVAPVQDIQKAEGGYTVGEIFARSDELDGNQVRVRGQVVKVTPNVMSTNWVRIMDSSSNQHLVVPTTSKAAVNDVVLVDGKLAINLDLGQGYVLPAVLQDAAVTIE
jgi:hypothetical protein